MPYKYVVASEDDRRQCHPFREAELLSRRDAAGASVRHEEPVGRADLDEVFGPEPVLLAPVQLRREREAAGVLLLEPLDARGLVTCVPRDPHHVLPRQSLQSRVLVDVRPLVPTLFFLVALVMEAYRGRIPNLLSYSQVIALYHESAAVA